MSNKGLFGMFSKDHPSALLKAYKEKVVQEIYDQLLNEAKPRLREAAETMARDLKATIESHVSDAERHLLVRIDLHINDEKINS